ncbi:MAG TPA: diiron oxygenase [Candidatus Tectomicrobia bacterium]|nr:diiron oxygenase [Candidatus Tectomicrobia bacterium]
MATYSYADCLQRSYRVNWKIEDVIAGRQFDLSRPWLPAQLSGAEAIGCLGTAEKVKLTHVEMGAYAHLFGYVEEFIAPKVVSLAHDFQLGGDRAAFDALTNFAAEEVKHMTLFREVRGLVDRAVGFPLALLPNAREVARAVLARQTGAVLLLTAAIEWFTQAHYLTCFKDNEALDPFTKHIFKCHWLEESQHARMDHLETLRAFARMSESEKNLAISDLIDLVGAVDGLLQQQSRLDVRNLERYLGRPLSAADQEEIYTGVLGAKRYTFIETGVTHPNFQELFGMVTTRTQQERVERALAGLLHPAAA